MKKLIKAVQGLRKGSVKKLVEHRMREFEAIGKASNNEIYKELCFCTLTANFDAEKSIAIQENICDGFLNLNEKQLEKELRKNGYRYPNRAAYLLDSRKLSKGLKKKVFSFEGEFELRAWLVENVKGLGMKEASHFMRNIGFENVAIIDFHILDLLEKEGLIERPKTMTRKRYLEIEQVLKKIADRLKMSLAELDLYLWFLETGKILK